MTAITMIMEFFAFFVELYKKIFGGIGEIFSN